MLKGLGNLANVGSLLKQAQQMGSRMQELNERLKVQRVTGAAGGGMVEVEVNGVGEMVRVRIDPSLFDRGDREMIEDLIPSAMKQAQVKAKQLHAEAIRDMTGGVEMPGLEDALANLIGDKPNAS